MLPYFLDIEASGLSFESYPIEIAWGADDGTLEEHLISPSSIAGWTHWDPAAEKIHRLQRERVLREGKAPDWICNRVDAQLSGKEVYSDNPDWDSMWLACLFDACGRVCPPIGLLPLDDLFIELLCPDPSDRIRGLVKILMLKSTARRTVGSRHRAGKDVQYMLETYQLVRNEGPKR